MPNDKKSRILVVDDDPVNLLVIAEILSSHFDLATASTGDDAVSLASSFKPDLVLIDLLVQDGDGYSICKLLKSNPKLKFTKIILVSTKALLKDRLFGYQAGADDYIARPFDPEELIAKAKVFIRLKSVEEVDRAKDDLINLFSHETRTPLNAIIGFGKLLAESPSLPADEMEFVKTIIDSGMSLLSLSNKAIMLSTLRQEGRTVNRTKACLRTLTDNAISDIPESFRAKGITITNECQPLAMMVDEHMVEVAIAFVVENALKFSDPGTKVTISQEFDEANGTLRVSVTDQGCGITPERMQSIFDEFGVEDVAHHSRGHGLSLSIVKLVMDAHEGEVSAAANPEGKGSKFTMTFNKSSLAPA